MSSNTYSNPRLFIGNVQINSFDSVSFTDSGKNQATSLNVSILDPEYRRAALIGKEIKFFLNYGSDDTVPFFRGRIRSVIPSDTKISISAFDVRTFLTGNESIPLSLTDSDNYDGYSLGQFLYDYITTHININETIIGLDMLNESDPVVTLSGLRGDDLNPLGIINSKLEYNSDDFSDIKLNRLTIIDDGLKSNICFVKEQSKDDAGVRFNYSNGIEKINVKKRARPNIFSAKVGESNVLYKHNNLKSGVGGEKIEGEFEYPDEAVQAAYIRGLKAEDDAEITLETNKGHYLNIGNVVYISIPDYTEVSGKHRIVSKQVSYSKGNVKCSLKLSKEGPKVSEYI
jgi:hypothetical protein